MVNLFGKYKVSYSIQNSEIFKMHLPDVASHHRFAVVELQFDKFPLDLPCIETINVYEYMLVKR